MRSIVSAVVFSAVSFCFLSGAEADGGRGQTTWGFKVTYSTGQFTESADPTESGQVLMYTGATWRCRREAVSLTERGNLMGGFFCHQPAGTGQVYIRALCEPNNEGSDFSSSMISDSTTTAFMKLSAFCTTKVAARAAPTKSVTPVESNL
ncbi:MAG TPA: hypothetical protein VLT33_14860 [Labilithrix sp.]|nr:hypothetical protein [Labilithrix sp.]